MELFFSEYNWPRHRLKRRACKSSEACIGVVDCLIIMHTCAICVCLHFAADGLPTQTKIRDLREDTRLHARTQQSRHNLDCPLDCTQVLLLHMVPDQGKPFSSLLLAVNRNIGSHSKADGGLHNQNQLWRCCFIDLEVLDYIAGKQVRVCSVTQQVVFCRKSSPILGRSLPSA